jgi:hypothetical protein
MSIDEDNTIPQLIDIRSRHVSSDPLIFHIPRNITRWSTVIRRYTNFTLDEIDEIDFLEKDLNIEDDCCICLTVSECILPCNHIVCKSCIIKLTVKKCPMCRENFKICYIKI